MERTSPSPLAQAIAAIFDLLIAALAEHAAEHPLLAPGIRATIRQIEQTARKLDRMIAEWEATIPTQTEARTRGAGRAGFSLPASRTTAIRMKTERRSEAAPSLRLSVSTWNRLPSARAPPARLAPCARTTPPDSLRPGAAPTYACA
jgi:hypothetical protein